RSGRDGAGGGVAHHDDGHETLVAQDAAILQQRLVGGSDEGTVDVDVPAVDGTRDARPAVHEVDHDPVLGEGDVLPGHAGRDRQVPVGHQVTPLPVDRQDVAGSDDVVAVEQLAGAGVAGDVHQGVLLVHDRGAEPGEPVDDAVDGVLVAGDEG